MTRPAPILLVVAIAPALLLYSIGCGESPAPGSCPTADDPLRITMSTGDYQHIRGWDASIHEVDGPDEIFLRITSEDLVEVVYERNDEIVVETYSASDTKIVENWKEEG